MLPRTAALVALAILAGCVAPAGTTVDPAARADVDAARPEVTIPKFALPLRLGVVELGAEPSVAVSPEGVVYVSTPGALWRSDDQGATFQPLGNVSGCMLSPSCDAREPDFDGADGDSSIAAGPGGFVAWTGLNPNSGRPTVPFRSSGDFGASWSEPFDVAQRNWSDRQWISRDDDGALFVAWRDAGNVNDSTCVVALFFCVADPREPPLPHGLFVRASLDGGATWSNRTRVLDDSLSGPVATDPASAWIYLPNTAHGVGVARSADRGATWENVVVRPEVPNFGTFIFPVAAVDDAGTVYLAWAEGERYLTRTAEGIFAVDRAHNRPTVYLSRSADHGETWSAPRRLSPPGVPSVFPWIAAGAPGRVVATWYEATAPTPSDRLPNVWNVAVAMSATADADEPLFVHAFANAEPHHVGSLCTSGLFCSLTAGDRSLLDFFQVQLLPDGSPIIAYAADADERGSAVEVLATRMMDGTRLR